MDRIATKRFPDFETLVSTVRPVASGGYPAVVRAHGAKPHVVLGAEEAQPLLGVLPVNDADVFVFRYGQHSSIRTDACPCRVTRADNLAEWSRRSDLQNTRPIRVGPGGPNQHAVGSPGDPP